MALNRRDFILDKISIFVNLNLLIEKNKFL